MAGPVVPYPIARFQWSFTQQSGSPPTQFKLKWGTQSGSYPNVVTYAATIFEANLRDVLPGDGQYYAVITASNSAGDGTTSSPETPFVAETVIILIGAQAAAYSHAGVPVSFIHRDAWLRHRK